MYVYMYVYKDVNIYMYVNLQIWNIALTQHRRHHPAGTRARPTYIHILFYSGCINMYVFKRWYVYMYIDLLNNADWCIYICTYIYISIHIYLYICIHVWNGALEQHRRHHSTGTRARPSRRTRGECAHRVYTYIYTHTHVDMYVHIYLYVHICAYVCMSLYLYLYMYNYM